MAYTVLTASREIRIVHLQPGSRAEDLVALLKCVHLDALPPYDALSYCWHTKLDMVPSPGVSPTLNLDGCERDITPNLASALIHLRHPSTPRLLWIDMLCINQHDRGEQEQQVALMGEIFRAAQNVVVWLGDADPATAHVWSLLDKLRQRGQYLRPDPNRMPYARHHGRWSGLASQPAGSPTRSMLPPEFADVPHPYDIVWSHLRDFLSREWFERIWCVQEVVVSQRCHVVCGTYVMSWRDFCSAAFELHDSDLGDVLKDWELPVLLRDYERWQYLNGQYTSLRNLLRATRLFRSSRPHDKIFALLSMIQDVSSSRLTIHYETTIVDLFCEVARTCIVEDKSLAILGEVELRHAGVKDMPSWVPDWLFPPSNSISFGSRAANDGAFRTSGGRFAPELLSSPRRDVLTLRGFLIKPVQRILRLETTAGIRGGYSPDRNRLGSPWNPETWHAIYHRAATGIPVSVIKTAMRSDPLTARLGHWRGPTSKFTPATMMEQVVRRTMSADLFPRPGGRTDVCDPQFPAYAAWHQDDFAGPPPPEVLWEHDNVVATTMFNRRGFIAGDDADAYLGIGLKTVKPGDWIAILLGGDTPFILRPLRSAEAQITDVRQWALVSECYVHGLMDGEAMRRIESPDFGYQDFELTGSVTLGPKKAKTSTKL